MSFVRAEVRVCRGSDLTGWLPTAALEHSTGSGVRVRVGEAVGTGVAVAVTEAVALEGRPRSSPNQTQINVLGPAAEHSETKHVRTSESPAQPWW